MANDARAHCRLYLITPDKLPDLDAFARTLEEALSAGDVACLQLRLKGAGDDEIAAAVAKLMPIAHRHEVAFILNDRPDLAASLDCDGVHIGPEDMSYREARAVMGADKTVGVTCKNSRHLAMELAEGGADYVAFGAFFPTTTKADTTPADIETVAIWSETTNVPCVAIGGITVENCRDLVEAGADFIAVSSGVWGYAEGPAAAVVAFNAAFTRSEMDTAGAAHPVQMQLDAYNARDIDAFMMWWADDAQAFEFPSRLLANGAAEIRERHIARFKEPNLFGKLLHRIVVENMVIDHERVSRTFPDGPGEVDVVAMYEVLNGKIAKAWFKVGTPRTFSP